MLLSSRLVQLFAFVHLYARKIPAQLVIIAVRHPNGIEAAAIIGHGIDRPVYAHLIMMST